MPGFLVFNSDWNSYLLKEEMKIMKFKIILLTTALTAALAFTSVIPAMAETTSWTSPNLKETKMSLTKVASYSYNKIKLTWEPLAGVDGYQIFRSTSKTGTFTKVITIKDPTKSTCINGSRTCGKTFYYKIRAYKKTNGKTVYSKYSSILSAYAKPAKVTINEVYGHTNTIDITLDWKAVLGATGYEQQVNQFVNGKWTGWRTYTYDEDGSKKTFVTYASALQAAKKQNPSGYITLANRIDGKNVIETISVEEYAARSIKKTQARLDIVQDDSLYKFRVRSYRTVNGKKVYGSWSNEYTLTETLDMNEILAELEAYTIAYAAANEPGFHYDETRSHSTSENSNYYIDGIFGAFSVYAKQQDVIESYKDNIERYVSSVVKQGGQETGFLYIKKVCPGDKEGLSVNNSTETYYKIWMLY